MNQEIQNLKRVQRADVYQGSVLAGHLTRLRDGGIEFSYTDDYIESGERGIASALPSSPVPYVGPGGGLPAFFSGLLPEGHRLTVLKDAAKTSLSDELTLLMIVGGDTPGNVRVAPAGTELIPPPAVAAIADSKELDFAMLARGLDRHSIPGVQEKISATMLTTPLALDGGAYLLKLNPRDHAHLVANEALHLRGARALKLPVAKSQLVFDTCNVEGLLVERFDRQISADSTVVARYAQEDGLQVLDLPPALKYSVSAEQISEALASHCQAPILAKRNLYLQFLFAWLTGNGDLHGKNVSMLADTHGRFSIAPIYDIPCTLVYGDDTMALTVAGKVKNLKRKHWQELARTMGLTDRAAQSANQLALKAASLIDLSELPFEGSPLRGTQRELRFRRMEIG
ncbi:type II toxin-antitoxin system HipA family toxin [Glutamicibacter sp. 287]|uniref:type II toxin-antitoxin system HipA family toxin n=1 Tax=unclassified Glutamicibacter TaxID=2627139 RepID=UPI000BB7F927|nr:HipA domain-containing protein [Glutamicibacter sp. BW80]PCC29583.1 HipA-like protein [Glutamicibacter sp. BW80]